MIGIKDRCVRSIAGIERGSVQMRDSRDVSLDKGPDLSHEDRTAPMPALDWPGDLSRSSRAPQPHRASRAWRA